MTGRTLVAVAVLAVVLIAGCNAPAGTGPGGTTGTPADAVETPATATDAPTETTDDPGATETDAPGGTTAAPGGTTTASPTPEAPVRVTGESLPFDATAVYERVRTLLGFDGEGGTFVQVKAESERQNVFGPAEMGFASVMGYAPPEDREVAPAGVTSGTTVTLYLANQTDFSLEETLAHEYVHVFQSHQNARESIRAASFEGANAQEMYQATIEGAAEYATIRYVERHHDEDVARSESTWREYPAYVKFAVAPYYFGSRYVAWRVDSPAGLTDVYEDPPRTMEQVIHHLAPEEDLPRNLTATATADTAWYTSQRQTMGELLVRVALWDQLNATQVDRGATGWGADTLLTFQPSFQSEERGYAWSLRWDSATDAREFERAFRTYLERRATLSDGVWRDGPYAFRLENTSDETVVVLAGHPAFVTNATVSGNASHTVVGVPPSNGSEASVADAGEVLTPAVAPTPGTRSAGAPRARP